MSGEILLTRKMLVLIPLRRIIGTVFVLVGGLCGCMASKREENHQRSGARHGFSKIFPAHHFRLIIA